MAKQKYDIMWKMLSEYQFDINPENLIDVTCMICHKILINACQVPCGCRYCKKCIETYLEVGPKKCLGTKSECNEDLLDTNSDIQIDHRANRVIGSLKVQCVTSGCSFNSELENMNDHVRMCNSSVTECPYVDMGCESYGVAIETVTEHLQKEIISHTQLLTGTISNMKNDISESSRQINNLENEIKRLQDIISEQNNLMERHRSDIEAEVLRRIQTNDCDRLDRLEAILEKLSKSVPSEDCFIWKVDNFREKVNEARAGIRSVVNSEPFYTHKYGYKLRLSMHPNGYGHREGTHLYVLFCVMKGDYDDLLAWPLRRPVVLSLIDRNDGSDYCSYTFSFDHTEHSFQGSFKKPLTNMNTAVGIGDFIEIEQLFRFQNLLRNDSIFIKCTLLKS